MSLKKIVFIFLFIFSFSKSDAQNFEYGKASQEELQQKVHPLDSTAAAAIIFKKGRTFYTYRRNNGFILNHEYTFRIKIYKKEGLSWATFQVPYYVGYEKYNDDVVKFSNCATYNLENDIVVKTKLKGEGVFKNEINKNWAEASILLPNVKVGSVIEIKYLLKSENLVKFPVYNFQYDIPVNYAEYDTEIPEYFVYKPILTGYTTIKSEAKYAQGSQNFEDEHGQSGGFRYSQINSKYSVENMPALKEEAFVDNIINYKTALYHELESTRFPNEKVKDYSMTWEGVTKTIFKDNDFGKQLEERDFLMQDIKLILKDVEEKNKLNVIFEFVKNKMNWNNEYGYFTNKGVKKAYLEKTGNCAEINFILIDMLKLAGIKANPVLISTVDHGVPVYPNRTVYNYVVAAVEREGKQVLLDATQKYTTQNILPLNALNWNGRLIRADGTSEEIILAPTFQSNINYTALANIDSQGKISGKLRIQKTNYEAYSFREKNNAINTDTYLEKLENELGGARITDYKIENRETDLMNPITETFTFVSNNHYERIGGKLFINPLLFFAYQKNPFVMEKRQMPIYFGFPKQMRYNLTLEIPEGYEVESLPTAIKLTTEDNTAIFSILSASSGDKIQISIIREINKSVISPSYYNTIKDFFQKMIVAQNEKIVLKKI
jgi:hypothetical protein